MSEQPQGSSTRPINLTFAQWILQNSTKASPYDAVEFQKWQMKPGRWNRREKDQSLDLSYCSTVAYLWTKPLWKGAFISTWDGLLEDFKSFQAQLPQGATGGVNFKYSKPFAGQKRRRGKSLYHDRSVKCVNHLKQSTLWWITSVFGIYTTYSLTNTLASISTS